MADARRPGGGVALARNWLIDTVRVEDNYFAVVKQHFRSWGELQNSR